MREVLSYARRGSRFTPRQADAWAAHHTQRVIPDQAVDGPGFAWSTWFGREAPLIVEIGSGSARRRRAGLPGPTATCRARGLAARHCRNAVRVAEAAPTTPLLWVDAIWSLEHTGRRSCAGPSTSSPTRGPSRSTTSGSWSRQGSRHVFASRLGPGAEWRLATDWAAYAVQMRAVPDAEPTLQGGVVERWADRPVTSFERKGTDVGRAIVDFCYRRADLRPAAR